MEKFALRVICLLFSFSSFSTMAAVSDKVSPNWSSNNAAVTQTDELFFFSTTYIGIGLLICAAIALVAGKNWLVTFMVLMLTVISYFLVKVFVLNIDYITQAALEEHLISPLYATTMALIIMIVLALGALKKRLFP